MNQTEGKEKGHVVFMRRCITLAHIAKKNGESPVGSIVLRNGEIIGEGIEAVKANLDITFHAEIEAIRKASIYLQSRNLEGCSLYTTHEPCIMCSYVIRQAKISTVVFGVATGETGGFSPVYPLLADTAIKSWPAPPTIISGVLEKECEGLRK